MTPNNKPRVTQDDLKTAMQQAGCGTYNYNAIFGKTRDPMMVGYRAKVMIALRDMGYSYNKIGAAVDRDHATVIYTIKKYRGEE